VTTTALPQTVPHQALYRRWRAQTFSQIVGQGPVVETLRNAVRTDRVSHAILFVGPRGTGKTSLARILAKALNCTDLRDGDPCDVCPSCVAIREGRALDLIEIDAATNRGIDAIRDLRERINYAPTDLRRKVYILDEAHQITRDAWNVLLKSLEEPPDFVVFMFASTHPQAFPPAILSRLQRYDVRRLTIAEIQGKLTRILEAEAIAADPAAIELIARLAAGGMRDAETMLDQLLAAAGDRIEEAQVRDLLGLAEGESIDRLLGALVDGDPIAGIAVLDDLDERGRDIGVVLDQVIEAVRAALSIELGPAGDPVRVAALARVARRLAAIDPERRGVGGLRLQVELALFAAVGGRATVPAAAPAPSMSPPVKPTEAKPAEPLPAEPAPAPPKAVETASVSEVDGAPPSTKRSRAAPAQPVAEPDPVTASAREDPAPPVPAEESGPPASVPGPAGVDELRAAWRSIVAELSQNPPVKPLIDACRPVSVDGNVVTLGFPEGKAFLKDLLERRRSFIEEGIGRALGRAVAVRCVATNLDLVPQVPGDEDSAFVLSEARRIFADDLVDVGEVS
jgi:DNA polymerase-3 subunit gamma/tau